MNGRRDFLRSLASLPLIGGSVALIGQPSAVAEPVTVDMLECYKTWLTLERRFLCADMAKMPEFISQYRGVLEQDRAREIGKYMLWNGENPGFHGRSGDEPAARAALVLSTVGCDWRSA